MDRLKKLVQRIPAVPYLLLWMIAMVVYSWSSRMERLPQVVLQMLSITLQMAILFFWCISLHRRITDRSILRCVLMIGGSLWLFLLFRSIKYAMNHTVVVRYLWYGYYIPMLLIPTLFFWLAECSGPETDRDRYYRLTAIPTVLLLVGVLTNDLHQQAFYFLVPLNDPAGFSRYRHGIFYFACVAWIFLMTLAAILRLYHRCRQSGTFHQLTLPFGLVLLAALYCGRYVWEIQRGICFISGTDLAACFSLFAVALLEACILSGLLPSNIGYDWCFNHSTIHAQIVDEQDRPVYQSAKAPHLEEDEMAVLRQTGRLTRNREEREAELIRQSIPGGAVIWERDVGLVNQTLRQLEHTHRSIEEVTEALSARIETEAQKNRIRTQNRLYSRISRKLEPQQTRLQQLLELAREAEQEDYIALMRQVTLLGVYIKRCSNLLLLREQAGASGEKELRLAVQETFDNLADSGIRGEYLFREPLDFSMDTAIRLYEFLESLLEPNYFTLREIYIILTARGMTIEALGARQVPRCSSAFFEQEENGLVAFLPLEGGGEA